MNAPLSGDKSSKPDLIRVLMDNKVISSAQAQLATADQEVTGMAMEEILMARGWVTQSVLDQFAPWLKQRSDKESTVMFQPGERTYEENLKEYRRLMERILGSSWD
jgi:hypothetical protein